MGHKSPNTTIIYLNDLDADPMAFRAVKAATKRAAQVKRLRAADKANK
ncbi:hypothetical protein [Rhizobium sp. BK251]|nr:hypothetical protein [Rhizobium sp. BK251]